MATATFTATPVNRSDAEFRAWGKAVSDALTAVGLPFTDDPQVDWTTVLRPTTSYVVVDEFRRFNDSLQGAAPLYLRIGYGTGYPTTAPFLRIYVGKGTTGAGVLTGYLLDTWCGLSGHTDTVNNCYISTGPDGSMLGVALFSSSRPAIAVVERSIADNGSATGTGVFCAYSADSTGTQAHQLTTVNYASRVGPTSPFQVWSVLPPATSIGLANGTTAPMFQHNAHDGAGNWWRPRSLLAYMNPDAGAFVPVALPGLGTYLPLGSMVATGNLYSGQKSTWAMRWG